MKVLEDGALPVSETPRPGECPTTLFEDTPVLDKEERSFSFPGSSGAHSIRFSLVRCINGNYGEGDLQVYVTKSDAGRESTWQLFEDDRLPYGVVEMGFSKFPEWDEEPTGQGFAAVVEMAQVPGLFAIAYLRVDSDNRNRWWTLEEWLLDLRSGTPRAVATASWEHHSEGAANGDKFSCSWIQVKKDFRCEERREGRARRFWLLSGQSINASLAGTAPLGTAKPGALVYVPGIGRTRLVASLGPGRRLVGPPFDLVERTAEGWGRPKSWDPRPKLGWVEATEAPKLRVREVLPVGRDRSWDRMWEVESGDAHYLVAMPGPHSLRVGLRMDLEPDASSPLVELDQEPLMISRRGDAFEALVQPPARTGGNMDLTFDVDGKGESDKACAYTADLTFEIDKGFILTPRLTQVSCERPMLPLVPRPRFGHMDVLFGEGNASGEGLFSLRGLGRVTTVLLDGGVADPWWEELAVSLPKDIEVLRLRDQGSSSDPVHLVPFALSAVSAGQYALVSVGATAAVLPKLLGALPVAPLAIVLVEPRGLDPIVLGRLESRLAVLSRDPEELRRWREAGAVTEPLTTDTKAALEHAVLAAASR